MNTSTSKKPLDHWTATSDGRVIDASGATVCVCYQLPLDPVPAVTKAQFIAKACNAYDEHVAAMRDLLGDRSNIQEYDGRIICVCCGRDYTGDDVPSENCDIDDCPSFAARCAVAEAEKQPQSREAIDVSDNRSPLKNHINPQ